MRLILASFCFVLFMALGCTTAASPPTSTPETTATPDLEATVAERVAATVAARPSNIHLPEATEPRGPRSAPSLGFTRSELKENYAPLAFAFRESYYKDGIPLSWGDSHIEGYETNLQLFGPSSGITRATMILKWGEGQEGTLPVNYLLFHLTVFWPDSYEDKMDYVKESLVRLGGDGKASRVFGDKKLTVYDERDRLHWIVVTVEVDPRLMPAPTPDPINKEAGDPYDGPYPKLDKTLQEIVRQYETGEATEAEAAAIAYEFYRNTVLVQVVLTPPDDQGLLGYNTFAVKRLFENNKIDPAWADPFGESLNAYGYVPVGLLAEFSQDPHLHALETPPAPSIDGLADPPEVKATRAAPGRQKPKLSPLTLKGYKNYSGHLLWKFRGWQPQSENAEAAINELFCPGQACAYDTSEVVLEVWVRNTPEYITEFQRFRVAHKLIEGVRNDLTYSHSEHTQVFVVWLPLIKVLSLVQLEGVREVRLLYGPVGIPGPPEQ